MFAALSPTATDILLSLDVTPDAGHTVRRTLCERGLSSDIDHTVLLLTSEIVSNAVRHAGPLAPHQRIVFHARLSSDHVRVEVADHGPGFDPEVRHTTPGFGLRLVDKLASRWGVECSPRGCRVWFEVNRRRRHFERLPAD